MQRMLDQDDINAELVSQSAQPTIAKLRVISRQQQVVRLDFKCYRGCVDLWGQIVSSVAIQWVMGSIQNIKFKGFDSKSI